MLEPFDYAAVRLTSGPLRLQLDHAVEYYSRLEEDRLLKVYRESAGLPAPGEHLGGWYDPGAFAPGHCLGQIIAALSRLSAITGDAKITEKVRRLVDGFAQTLEGGRSFYSGHRFKAYLYDKHVLGLTEAYRTAGIERAKAVLARATEVALADLPEKALSRAQQTQRPHPDVSYTWDESYTLAEHLFEAHAATGDERYRKLARRFLHDEEYFNLLAEGQNVLPGLHAYSHVNALSSAARAYLALGEAKHLKAAANAWEMIEQTQSYASGGWGPEEAFVEPNQGKLGQSLTSTRKHFETPCGSYAHMKLARYLLRITGEARYGDGLERVLYNGIAAALAVESEGRAFYYSDYAANARKTYHPERWTCCAGSYPLAVADYGVSAYFHDAEGIYVNLYTPSEAIWKSQWGPVRLVQRTGYPLDPTSRIEVELQSPADFSVHLRVPRWAEGMSLRINGTPHTGSIQPGTFTHIHRLWKSGDAIEIKTPLSYRLEPIDPQHPDRVAILKGPLLMVAIDSGLTPFLQVRHESYTTYCSTEMAKQLANKGAAS